MFIYYAINIQTYEYLLSYIEDRKILVLDYIFLLPLANDWLC